MFKSLILSCLGFLSVSLAVDNQYCATILPTETDGASGFAAVQISDGQAKYDFSLDLTNYPTTCDLSKGLKYHVHSFWNNATSNSASGGTYCGGPITGGHYDPNFACSVNSQAYGTNSGYCYDLGRIPPQYNYSCTAALYNAGKYSYCEIGDISGKNGVVFAETGTKIFSLSAPFVDYQPLYAVNYDTVDVNSLQWTSWVFHCAADGNRLMCGKLSPTDLDACSTSFATFNADSTGDDDSYSASDYTTAIIVSVLVCIFAGAALGVLFSYIFCKGSAPLASK